MNPFVKAVLNAACAGGLLAVSTMAIGQFTPLVSQTVSLWPNGAPGSEKRRAEPEIAQDYWVRNVHSPSLTVYRPPHPNGTAVIVIPGGGHQLLVWTNEGVNFGRALNRYGLTVFVLKYRLAREAGSTYQIEDAVTDTRRAVRWVRAHAADYGVDPNRIGIMGFSAGGELVSLEADNLPKSHPASADAIDRFSDRPDFQVLVFPGPLGVPADDVAHAPPAFIAAGTLDDCCATPAVALYEQLRKGKRDAELHMFAGAGHAFNLDESTRISIIHWPDRLIDWLSDEGFMTASMSAKPAR